MKDRILECRIAPPDIMFVNCALEAAEDIGIIHTVDVGTGKVVFYTTCDMLDELIDLLNALRTQDGIDLEIRTTHTRNCLFQ